MWKLAALAGEACSGCRSIKLKKSQRKRVSHTYDAEMGKHGWIDDITAPSINIRCHSR
jgi:hypothetical protein